MLLEISIGDLPVGAGVAMATPDKERNLSTRNQNVMNKELFTIMKTVHDALKAILFLCKYNGDAKG